MFQGLLRILCLLLFIRVVRTLTAVPLELVVGPEYFYSSFMAACGDEIYFAAQVDGSWNVYATDGSEPPHLVTQRLVEDDRYGITNPYFFHHEGYTYFQNDNKLWKTAGTPATTEIVKEVGQMRANMYAFDNKIFFGVEHYLWKSDGTFGGTEKVNALPFSDGYVGQFIEYENELYFMAEMSLKVTDGTDIRELTSLDSRIKYMLVHPSVTCSGMLYFVPVQVSTNYWGVWMTDGDNLFPVWTTEKVQPSTLTCSNQSKLVYFIIFDGSALRLRVTDGTDTYTAVGAGLRVNYGGAVGLNGNYYFPATDSDYTNWKLWESDGENVWPAASNYPGSNNSPRSITPLGDNIFFIGTDNRIWVLQGNKTYTLHDLDPLGPDPSRASGFVRVNDKLFFKGYTPETGRELWVIDTNPNASPVAKCPEMPLLRHADEDDTCYAETEDFNGGSTDPDEDPLGFEIEPSFTSFSLGTTDVTLIVTDGRGGSDSCEASLFCNDPPVAACKNLVQVADATDACYAVAQDFNDASSDHESTTLSFELNYSGDFALGATPVTLSVTDEHGASSYCRATMLCHRRPIAICQSILRSVNETSSNCTYGPMYPIHEINNGSFDPDGDGITLSLNDTGPYEKGVTNVELTVTDDHGEMDTCVGAVNVEDKEALTSNLLWCGTDMGIVTPCDVPLSFFPAYKSKLNHCPVDVHVTGEYSCRFCKAKKVVDRECIVSNDEESFTVSDTGGPGDFISWDVEVCNQGTDICETFGCTLCSEVPKGGCPQIETSLTETDPHLVAEHFPGRRALLRHPPPYRCQSDWDPVSNEFICPQ